MTQIVLTRINDGEQVHFAPGDELLVRFEETASGGFRWSLEPVDDTRLRPLETRRLPAPSERIGTPNAVEFRFFAGAPGRSELRFKLWRSWEGDASVIDRCVFIVDIA